MANHLKMADVHAIQALQAQGWSFRRIGRELGLHRDTVRRYCQAAPAGTSAEADGLDPPHRSNLTVEFDEKTRPDLPAWADGQNRPNPPAGSEDQNRPNPPTGSSGPPSQCEPFREIIDQALERGLSFQRIWQDLRFEHGFTGGYDSVKRFARRLAPTQELPFRRMECAPGAEAQVDFGTGAPVVIPAGEALPVGVKTHRRKTHVLRVVLSHSRKGYSEAVYRQTTEDFLRALENAFWYFGGVPRTVVLDNLKAAVIKADWFDPELNPKIQSFCRHYGTVVLPTKPRMPRHKGKVEKGVDYVQGNALKGKTFNCLTDENRYLLEWETQVADTRIHGTTRRQVHKAFEETEKLTLLPLPNGRFPSFKEGRRKVNRDGYIEVDKAYYSAPPEYLGRELWVRWDGRVVRLFNARFEQIAIHLQREPGRFSTREEHIDHRKRAGVEQGATRLLRQAGLIGLQAGRWAEQMLHVRGIEGVRVLMGLLSLAKQHSATAIEQACQLAGSHGAYHLRTIRELLKRQGGRQEQFEFIEEHPIIRPMAEYAERVRQSLGLEEIDDTGFPELLPLASFPSPKRETEIYPIPSKDLMP